MLLTKLADLPGVSGDEGAVRKAIIEEIAGLPLRWRTDSMGNLLVRKEGKVPSSRAVMLAAHMDEVGLMVVSIEESGHLRFKPLGGIDSRVLVSKRVRVGPEGIPGVIGAKAIHLQKAAERKPFESDQLYIDIGAKDREEAEKHISIGAYVSFDTRCVSIGEGFFRGKAFDDRAGCAALLELLRRITACRLTPPSPFRKRLGYGGARVAAYTLQPQLALALEATAAADTPDTKEEFNATTLGKGPALTFMDRTLSLIEILQGSSGRREGGDPLQLPRRRGGPMPGPSLSAGKVSGPAWWRHPAACIPALRCLKVICSIPSRWCAPGLKRQLKI